jgi:caffeoyl-CoA O-methyltransferase
MGHDDVFTAVDDYVDGLFAPPDPALQATLDRSREAGLPEIGVSSNLGRLLHVLALARGARTVLEIGTLGGYSTIWLARALPSDGRLVSLEFEPAHAEIARRNIADAGLADLVDIRVGRALDTLTVLQAEGVGPFDMVFIDADKEPYAEYFDAAVRLGRPGTLIVADNVVRRGRVALGADDEATAGIRRFNARMAADTRVAGAIVQTVGVKGHDGLALAVVTDGDVGV